MTERTDIVEQLAKDCRTAAKCLEDCGSFESGQSILREAADTIQSLRSDLEAAQARVAELEGVVDDISEWSDMHAVSAPEWRDNDRVKVFLSIGTLRKVAALTTQEDEE